MKPLLFLFILASAVFAEPKLPTADQRAAVVRDLNTPRIFPEITSRGHWKDRAQTLREQALVSAGLWPLPDKPPLNARIFDRVERDGYSIEKVYFQTYPGFYLAGNLYRPLGKGKGPFPAVLNPHGHGQFGRLHDDQAYSNPARCIQFARMGMIAFSYDMVGYNDTMQLGPHRTFLLPPELQLWNINLLGLQTWNSLRALDFLESLPDVDKRRLACTGESGGGTQTFLLGAVDSKLAALAPICMVSSTMQGGCQCENAPGLRVDFSNMEYAAVPAPTPQIMVAATGDWTKLTLTVEGPAVASIYKLLGAPHRLKYELFNFGHNYNQTTREAVYGWFNQHLLGARTAAALAEQPYQKLPNEVTRVWPDLKLPTDALKEEPFIRERIREAEAQLATLQPHDQRSLRQYQRTLTPAWQRSLQLEQPTQVLSEKIADRKNSSVNTVEFAIGRQGKGDRIPVVALTPVRASKRTMIVLVHPEGKDQFLDEHRAPRGLAAQLVAAGYPVLLPDLFLTGTQVDAEASAKRKYFPSNPADRRSDKFFSTYNRTDLQERVQDLWTVSEFARKELEARRVVMCGLERAGLWVMMAAPMADGVMADCEALDLGSDAPLMSQDLFTPGLRKLGAFTGVALMAAPNPLLLHDTGLKFPVEPLKKSYNDLGAGEKFRSRTGGVGEAELLAWVKENFTR